ncbi:MAG TPA: serine/threonine-protein kinase, partial [Pirellulaceae bacterium]|nr:serine/threonine-protein kinase [Pirellulaceae bacterium]
VVFRIAPGDVGARYTRTKVHDRGGMGQVWIARDNTLNRAVALKELRPDKHPTSTDYRRLSKEAQITGQLEHPNIVPVYELVGGSEPDAMQAGAAAGGTEESPAFYTMRLVRGQTFSSSIVEYHRRRKTGVPHPLEFQRLLRSFLAICHAVGYAHSRGVVHRDLKPGNVMLGSFGEVVVLDWGLAKVVGLPSDSEQHSPPIEVTHSKLDETSPGAPLGTLPYAAPEQVAGLHDTVDSRADIYGLGAILFCILTGVPPHRAENTEALKREKLAQPAPPARELNKDAPPALEAICRKAMAGAPKDRYATALQLADDIERWLADEPTSVYSESRTERAMRWLRKHRSRARAVVVSLVAVTLVAVIASLIVDQARRGEAAARRNAELALIAKNAALEEKNTALDKANWRLTVSRRVADLMLIGVGDMLKYYPAGRHLQLRLLEESLQDYEQLSDSQKDDVEVRAEVRRVHARVIDVRLQLGRYEEAERDLIKLLANWPAPAENATDELGERTGVLILRAELADRNGREDLAAVERMFREADAAASRLPSGHPTRIMLRLRRGQVHLRHQRVVAALADFAGASAELKTSGRADARAILTAALLEGQTLIAM